MDEIVLLYTTWPDAETAEAAAVAAVESHLAACANILGPMTSVYRWEGRIERQGEIPMILKTTAAAAPSLSALIQERHPYQTPCVLALPVLAAGSNPAFLAWICEHTPQF